MAKLHEILAVEGDLDAKAKAVMDAAVTNFTSHPDNFVEQSRSLAMFDDDRANENTDELKALVETVGDLLASVRFHAGKFFDTFACKEATNQTARADVVVDGETLLEAIPATVLLGLESKLKAVRAVYAAIPVLQTGVKWELDADRGAGIYRVVDPEVRMRTEKAIQHKILVEATKEHPAQVEKWTQDIPVGRITVSTWSSMLSQADKSQLLARVDALIRAVKKARQRANTAEVVEINVGDALFKFIHG